MRADSTAPVNGPGEAGGDENRIRPVFGQPVSASSGGECIK